MNKARYSTHTFVLFVTFFSALLYADSGESLDVLPHYQYKATDNPLSDVEQAKMRAAKEGKTLLVVMGANWCHDSRALASQFSNAQVDALLETHFVTQFVDVGYYRDLRDVTAVLGYPSYFATPTVLAFDPVSEALLNRDDVRRWQAAASLETEDVIDGLTDYSQRSTDQSVNSQQIMAYAQAQSARLQGGFAVLGPMLRAYDEDKLQDKQKFEDTWREVRGFRNQLQLDLQALWQGEKQVSELAEQPAFSWE